MVAIGLPEGFVDGNPAVVSREVAQDAGDGAGQDGPAQPTGDTLLPAGEHQQRRAGLDTQKHLKNARHRA